jgi:lysophospholipase L1-like esterase
MKRGWRQCVAAAVVMSACGVCLADQTIVDFGPESLHYTYGQDWKLGSTIKAGEEDGVGYVEINSTEHGGAGRVLGGKNLTAGGEKFLAITAKVLDGHGGATLRLNLMRDEGAAGFDLSTKGFNEKEYKTVYIPLGSGHFEKVNQIQIQGTNFSASAGPVKIRIDKIETTVDKKDGGSSDKKDAVPTDVPRNDHKVEQKPVTSTNPLFNAPAKDKPDVPAWGFYPKYPDAWQNLHNGYVARTKKGDIDVVFFGDSITQGWDSGLWKEHFAPLKAVNYGIGGDSTRQVLWRIENGEIEGIQPKAFVLLIGTNNLYNDFNSGTEAEIAAGITKIVKTLNEKSPQAKILLLGILPRQNEWFTKRIEKVNAIISKLDDGKNVRYLDLADKYQTAVGKVIPELYNKDQLHLVKPGYAVLADAILPVLGELLK